MARAHLTVDKKGTSPDRIVNRSGDFFSPDPLPWTTRRALGDEKMGCLLDGCRIAAVAGLRWRGINTSR
ncbi:hypothetical protein DESC_180023 [Desulfosarcina cetonica]|nr:hypothetical protein DESC_180023 [Desulfosarcina cetonica]